MTNLHEPTDAQTILGRLDRSSPDALLTSLATELLALHEANQQLAARIVALEATATLHDRMTAAIAATERPVTMPKKASVDAVFSLGVEAGFHGLEYDESGAPFRWTGPGRLFHFELFVDRDVPLDFRLRYSRVFVDEPTQRILCHVDGEAVEAVVVPVDGEMELRGTLPTRAGANGTVLMFACSKTDSPAERGGSEDTRHLGIQFRWLRVAESEVAVPASGPKRMDALPSSASGERPALAATGKRG